MKLNKKLAACLGVEYITVKRRFILINRKQQQDQMNTTNRTQGTVKNNSANNTNQSFYGTKKSIYTSTPVSLIFDQCFIDTNYF